MTITEYHTQATGMVETMRLLFQAGVMSRSGHAYVSAHPWPRRSGGALPPAASYQWSTLVIKRTYDRVCPQGKLLGIICSGGYVSRQPRSASSPAGSVFGGGASTFGYTSTEAPW